MGHGRYLMYFWNVHIINKARVSDEKDILHAGIYVYVVLVFFMSPKGAKLLFLVCLSVCHLKLKPWP